MKLKTLLTVGASVVLSTSVFSSNALAAELAGNITVWHSFTQGPRLEVIQEAANEFMKEL